MQTSDSVQTSGCFCSKSWIFYGFAAGLAYGLANTIFAIRCSKLGFWGVCLTGPIGLILLVYRIIEAAVLKKRTGCFIDYEHSNFFSLIPPQVSNEHALNNDSDDFASGDISK